MKNKFLLVGLGNILLRDEGVGVRVVEALQENFEFSADLFLLDGGTLGLDLLPYLEGRERILFVDAIDLKKEPGTIAVLQDEEIPSSLAPAISFHQIGLADLLFAARFKGLNPSQMILVGIQPERMEPGLVLSDTLIRNFDFLLNTIIDKLRGWGVEIREKAPGGNAPEECVHVPSHTI